MPFAVVGSNAVVDSGGRKVRGRVYPWGTVEGMPTVMHQYGHLLISLLFFTTNKQATSLIVH